MQAGVVEANQPLRKIQISLHNKVMLYGDSVNLVSENQ